MKTTFIARTLRTFQSLTAMAVISLPCARAATIPAPEKLLPDDTLVVVTFPDFAKMREIYKAAPQTQLWNDPAMKPFADKFTAKLKEELVDPLERELGVRLDDYASLPQGQLTLAVTQNGWQGKGPNTPGILLLLDSKDKSGLLKTNLNYLRRKWTDSGKTLKTEKIRDIEFSILPMSEKDLPKSVKKILSPDEEATSSDEETNKAPKTELVIGQYDSLLIVGSSTKVIEKIVAHLTGGSAPALADQAAFESCRLAQFRDAPFYSWVNVRTFIDVLTRPSESKEPDEANPFAFFDPKKIVAATGLGGIKTLAFSFQSSSDGVYGQASVGVPDSDRQGLLKIVSNESKDAGPPPFVPATAVKFARYRIDGQKAWSILEKVMSDVSPQLSSALNFMIETANSAERQKNPDFDIRKNLFGNLGDDMIYYEKAAAGTKLTDLNSAPSVFLLGSPHADQLAASLKSVLTLMNQGGGAPTEREFLGRKIYSAPLPQSPLAAGDPSKGPSTLNYAASGSYVAIATDVSMLEEYLRSSESQQKALKETPGLSEAAAKVGGTSTGWFGYENQVETTRAVLEVLRKSADDKGESMLAPGIPAFIPDSNLKEWLDFSLLPPFEKISKYFHFSVYSFGANAQGLNFKVFAPVPPALKK